MMDEPDFPRPNLEIPPAWTWATFEEVAEIAADLTDPLAAPHAIHVAPDNIESGTGKLLRCRTVAEDGVTSPKQRFAAGDVLYSKIRPHLNKATLAPFAGLCSADMYPIKARIHSRYLLHYILSEHFVVQSTRQEGRSVLPKINQKALKRLHVPVAPLPEQERLARYLDSVLTQLEAGEIGIQSQRAKLAAYRAAVLRAACEGRLVPTEAELARAEGREGADEWRHALLEEVCRNFDGRRVPVKAAARDARPGPYPYYGAQGIIDSIDDFLFDGEYLLVAEDGENLRSRRLPIAYRASGRFWVKNHAHVLQPREDILLSFLEIWLNAQNLQFAITGSAQPKLTQKALNGIVVRVPPLTEQHRIVAEVERRLSVVERLEAAIDANLARAKRLRQAILKRAFEGRLVPQDPNDEPASVLLERIRKEREAAARLAARKRRKVSE